MSDMCTLDHYSNSLYLLNVFLLMSVESNDSTASILMKIKPELHFIQEKMHRQL